MHRVGDGTQDADESVADETASASRVSVEEAGDFVEAFDAAVLPHIQEAVDADALVDTAASMFDVDREQAEKRFKQWQERYDADVIEPATGHAMTRALDRYLLAHDRYMDDIDALVDEALEEAVRNAFPTYLFRDRVTKLYDGAAIHPASIQRTLAESLAEDVEELVDDPATAARDVLYGRAVPVDALDGLEPGPETLHTVKSAVGEGGLHAAWNPDHPTVTTAAARMLRDDLGRQEQRLQATDPERAQAVNDLQDAYKTTLDRIRVEETMDAMEELWGREDLPYEVFAIDDADEMLRAAQDIGNCRADDRDSRYYRLLETDPYTTVLGIRRFDDHEWIGAARCFHLETADGASVFGIDNLGMQYREDTEGHDPVDGCNFKDYGDALPIMGLAAMRYGLNHGFDYVVAAGGTDTPDRRVGGGPGDWIGPAQLYGQNSATIHLDKRGTRTQGEPYGFRGSGPYEVRLLLENPARITTA